MAELEDFDPEDGHAHGCGYRVHSATNDGCDCAARLYAMLARADDLADGWEWYAGQPAEWTQTARYVWRAAARQLRAVLATVEDAPAMPEPRPAQLLAALDTRMTTASHHGSGTSERSRK